MSRNIIAYSRPRSIWRLVQQAELFENLYPDNGPLPNVVALLRRSATLVHWLLQLHGPHSVLLLNNDGG